MLIYINMNMHIYIHNSDYLINPTQIDTFL